MSRPARVIVNPSALKANLEVVRRHAPHAKVMAIVKADGYGHGVARVAAALNDHCEAFGVAAIEEAVTLRDAGVNKPVVLLEGPFDRFEAETINQLGLETVVHEQSQLATLAALKEDIPVWLKIDSGMHRLGFHVDEVSALIARLRGHHKTLRCMTHLASSHENNDASVVQQLREFDRAVADSQLEQSIANSGAILAWPQTHRDWVRPGIMLYGVSPVRGRIGTDFDLQPSMTVASKLIARREVAAGGGVGYGRSFVCPEAMPIGVVAFGYGDGYPRAAATGTPIMVDGVRTQVIGEASMDMLTVDLRPVPRAQVGSQVILWGDELPVEEVASAAGTIPYELLCRVRMRARYVELKE